MTLTEFAVNFFVALFALVDPIGNVPLFAAATLDSQPKARRLTAAYLALFAVLFLGFFFITGLGLLKFFGISMPAFRIAGGVLLILMGLDMARGDLMHGFADAGRETAELSTRDSAKAQFQTLIVPFGMPLLIGPGAISTAVIYADEARRFGLVGQGAGLAVIAALGVLVVLAFWMTGLISRLLGRIGMVIVVRVLGLILCAMAVQQILAGLAGSTVNLVRKDTAAPYQSHVAAPPASHRP